MKKIAAVVMTLVFVGAMTSCDGKKTEEGKAPDFELEDLEGNVVKLSELQGEKVYIEYWASWCSICLSGLEALNEFAGEENDFKILTIVSPDSDRDITTDEFKEWFKGMDNVENITVLLDKGGTYADLTGIRAYPTSQYIDSKGNSVKVAAGYVDSTAVKQVMEQIE